MKRLLASLALIGLLSSPAFADGTIDTLLGAAALVGTESVPIFQTANPAVKTTSGAIGNAGTLTGDATKAASSTVVTLKNTGPGATGPLGSATVAPIVTIDAQGRVTALSSATVTPAVGSVTGFGTGVATFLATPSSANLAAALTDETGTGANVFGTAPTISSPTINTAATLGFITGSTQCLQVNTSGVVSGTGAVCGGSGSTGANPTATASDTAVNGVATTFMRSDAAPAVQKASNAQFGLMEGDGSTITCTAGVCGFLTSGNAQVGTTYTVASTDKGKVVTLTNAAAVAVTIPVASTAGFGATFYTSFINEGAGLVTLTPTTSTIDGAASLTLNQNQSVDLVSDGTNYFTLRGRPTNVALARGTATLGTSAIASGACATVVTVSATGVATTDVVSFGYNSDPTAVTGYGASATGAVLTVYPYPTANNVNVKVCNSSSGSITPSAMTLNWLVTR